MQRKLFSFLIAGLVLTAAISWSLSARAALCDKCRDLMFVDSQGTCSVCGAPTASGALKLCPKCSAQRHQCEHCLAPLVEGKEAAADASAPPQKPSGDNPPSSPAGQDKPSLEWTTPPPGGNPAQPPGGNPVRPPEPAAAGPQSPAAAPSLPQPPAEKPLLPGPADPRPPAELPPEAAAPLRLKPINPAKAASYTAGKWHYQMQITGPGTRSEGRWGWLTYNGQKLPRGAVNDYYDTPWGPVYWVDVPATAWGLHGWMPVPLPQNPRPGRPLTLPAALADVQPVGTGSRAAAPPASSPVQPRPQVQTLEINKSHNGQLARVRVGNVLIIRLPGNPASGYQWRVATTTSPVVRQTVQPQFSAAASASGQPGPGVYTFVFQAVQPGSGAIRLYYMSPNDPNRPRDSFAVGVNVAAAAR